jgi:hypothetical protein
MGFLEHTRSTYKYAIAMYSPIPQFSHAESTLTSLILVQMLFSVWIITVSGLPYPCTLTNFVTAMDLYRTLRHARHLELLAR